MSTAENEAGNSRRDRRIDPAFIAVQRAQQTTYNENIFIIGLIIIQYPPKFLKIYILNTYEEQREKLKTFLY